MFGHLLLFFALMSPVQGVNSPMPVALETMQDHYRPLLVFAPTDRDRDFLRQIHLFATASYEMHRRDVLLVPLNATSEVTSGVILNALDWGKMSAETAASTRRRFHIPPHSFTVLLLGKDGGVKLRSHTPITIETLIRTIDSMPMRQQEMRERTREPETP